MRRQRDIEFEFRTELQPNEKTLWVGQPKPGLALKSSDAILIPFSLFWSGFAFTWEIIVLRQGITFMALFGVPFVLVGIYLLIGRFFFDAIRRKHTSYALTQKRIIIKSGIFNKTNQSILLSPNLMVSYTEKRNRIGSIVLRNQAFGAGMTTNNSWPTNNKEQTAPTLEMIHEAAKIYRQIIELQQKTN